MDNVRLENAIADIMSSKSYLPKENNLPKTSIVKSAGKYFAIKSFEGFEFSRS